MPKRKLANNTNSIKKSIKKKKVKKNNSIIKVDNVKVDNVKVNKVKVDNVKVDNVKVDNVKVNKVKVDNVKVNKVKVNNITKKNNNNNNNFKYININNILSNAIKNKNIYKTTPTEQVLSKAKFKTVEEYQADFGDIISFRKNLTKKDVDDIDMIVYHDENNDGMFSAAIAYHYLKNEVGKSSDNIKLLGAKPSKGKVFVENPEQYNGKNVLIVDLDYSNEYLQLLSRYCKSILNIDDHKKINHKSTDKIKIFNNKPDTHSAVAFVWKFFYPKVDIPISIQLIDNSDAKLFLPFIPQGFSNNFAQAIGHRFTHNKSPEIMVKKRNGLLFDELWEFIAEKSIDFMIFAGYYYQEVMESLKDQIAVNAKPANFQGYNVAVLNFNAPGLKKQVARQIMTNFNKMGIPIKFCVLWGYEYTGNNYDITLLDDHRPTSTLHLGEIATELGKIGGERKGGGGHQHQAHFYWPRNDKMDIWDLFSQKFIRN